MKTGENSSFGASIVESKQYVLLQTTLINELVLPLLLQGRTLIDYSSVGLESMQSHHTLHVLRVLPFPRSRSAVGPSPFLPYKQWNFASSSLSLSFFRFLSWSSSSSLSSFLSSPSPSPSLVRGEMTSRAAE